VQFVNDGERVDAEAPDFKASAAGNLEMEAWLKVKERWATLRDSFRALDRNLDGVLDKGEFTQFLESTGVDFTEDDLNAVWNRVDVDNDGRVKFTEFMKTMDMDNVDKSYVGKKQQDHGDKTRFSQRKLRNKLNDFWTTHGQNAKLAFRLLDTNGDGKVDVKEAVDLIKTLNLGASEDDIYGLLRSWDTDGSGTLDYNEFFVKMSEDETFDGEYNAFMARSYKLYYEDEKEEKKQRQMSHRDLVTAKKVMKKFSQAMNAHFHNNTDGFRYLDDNKDGVVSNEEFNEKLLKMDLNCSQQDLRTFVEYCDSNNNGYIDLVDFIHKFESQNSSLVMRPSWLGGVAKPSLPQLGSPRSVLTSAQFLTAHRARNSPPSTPRTPRTPDSYAPGSPRAGPLSSSLSPTKRVGRFTATPRFSKNPNVITPVEDSPHYAPLDQRYSVTTKEALQSGLVGRGRTHYGVKLTRGVDDFSSWSLEERTKKEATRERKQARFHRYMENEKRVLDSYKSADRARQEKEYRRHEAMFKQRRAILSKYPSLVQSMYYTDKWRGNDLRTNGPASQPEFGMSVWGIGSRAYEPNEYGRGGGAGEGGGGGGGAGPGEGAPEPILDRRWMTTNYEVAKFEHR